MEPRLEIMNSTGDKQSRRRQVRFYQRKKIEQSGKAAKEFTLIQSNSSSSISLLLKTEVDTVAEAHWKKE